MVCFLPLPFFKVSDAWLDPRLETESAMDASKPKPGEKWDQFEANFRLTGRVATYDESIYTTALDKSKLGESKEIERQAGKTIHEAEERGQKVDLKGLDEEDLEDGLAPKGDSSDAVEKDEKAKVGSPELAPGASEFAAWKDAEVELEKAGLAVVIARAKHKATWVANKKSMLPSGKSKAEAQERMAMAILEVRVSEENYTAVLEGADVALEIWQSVSEGAGGPSSNDRFRESKATDDPNNPSKFFQLPN